MKIKLKDVLCIKTKLTVKFPLSLLWEYFTELQNESATHNSIWNSKVIGPLDFTSERTSSSFLINFEINFKDLTRKCTKFFQLPYYHIIQVTFKLWSWWIPLLCAIGSIYSVEVFEEIWRWYHGLSLAVYTRGRNRLWSTVLWLWLKVS